MKQGDHQARLQEALRRSPIPDSSGAEERSWEVVRAVFETSHPAPQRRTTGLRLALAFAAASTVAIFALSPAGAAIRDWIEDAINPGEPGAQPLIETVPGTGTILAQADGSAWVVRSDGGRDRLGDFDLSTWSPNGLYVAAASGPELVALTPLGDVRWAASTPDPVRAVAWSPDEGYRIAYLAGDELRVIAGDGTGDHALAEGIGRNALAWQPDGASGSVSNRLTFVEDHRVITVDTDTGETIWRSSQFATAIRSLQWSDDGDRLLVGVTGANLIMSRDGDTEVKAIGPGSTGTALAPAGDRLAFVRPDRDRGWELSVAGVSARPNERILYRGPAGAPFGDPVFSPDGRWVLLPWPKADQWLFIRVSDRRVVAVADVARQFSSDRLTPGGFPRIMGWCC